MSFEDLNVDSLNPHTRRAKPANPPKNHASPAHVAALDILLGKLTRWEESDPVYREMLAAAEAKVQARALARG